MAELMAMLSDHTFRVVAIGSMILGFTSGALGCFALLRRQSMLGDAISHAALPGVALAFMLTLSRNPVYLVLGALIAGWIGSLVVQAITRSTRIRQDAALGIVLSVFFGIGLVLLSMIQNHPSAAKAGLHKFLFGNASTMLIQDLHTIAIIAVLSISLMLLYWKEFKVISFDADFARASGLPVPWIELLLAMLIVLGIVIGLQAVGVVLMSALVVAPAAAARQWTDRLGVMVLLAGLFGALSGIAGAMISANIPAMPTGPVIVLVVSSIVLISLICAPQRGLFTDWLRRRSNRHKVELARVLHALWRLVETDRDPYRPHQLATLEAIGLRSAMRTMLELESDGTVRIVGNTWHFTRKGLERAREEAASFLTEDLT